MPKLVIQMTVNELDALDHRLQSIWTGRADPEREQEQLFHVVHSAVNKLIQEAYELGKQIGEQTDLD